MSYKQKEPEIIEEWVLHETEIKTNVGVQTTDLACKLVKHYIHKRDITLFERFILGYKNYFYRINVTPAKEIRQNRDKEFLGAPTIEGNDATYEFSLGLGQIRHEELDLSRNTLNAKIFESLREYDPEYRWQKNKENVVEKKWTNKMLFKKYLGEKYNSTEIGLFTAIYPFHGSDLSGCTDLISLSISCNDDSGLMITPVLFGFHFYIKLPCVVRWGYNKFVKPSKPQQGDTSWSEYYPKLKSWEKEHPIRNLFYTDWSIEFCINRRYGFHFRKEFDNGSKGAMCFNPWRNKLWNLI